MRYTDISSSGPFGYPDHAIDPSQKDANWYMQYARAAYYDWSVVYPKGVFYNNGGDYEMYRLYALGKQPINQYKKLLGVDAETDTSWLNIDWSVRPIISVYRDRCISRLMKQEHGIVATPVDNLAKTEADRVYAEAKVKIAMREMMRTANPELVDHPMLKQQSGEAMDLEELEMRVEFGEQFNRSRDAELAIQLALYENDDKLFRKLLFEDLFDYGVAGYKEWLGEDNRPKFRKVDPEVVITSFCKKPDFSDMVHAGEVIYVSLIDLATMVDEYGNRLFSEQELTELASTIAGRWGNPRFIGNSNGFTKPYDKFKVPVLDMEFFTYNDYNWRIAVNEKGNMTFRRVPLGRGKYAKEKYQHKRVKCVCKVKWIVGTEKVYDYGMKEDQKRKNDPKKKSDTSLSYRFFAYNFYEMMATSMMAKLKPRLDDYQLTMYKIQNFKARSVPSGWAIDLDALENVALSQGGEPMTPKALIDMFMQSGILMIRSKEIDNTNVNYKSIQPIENTAASELSMFWADLVNTIREIENITGYNQITAGNPNPKTLTAGYEIAEQSTDDALFPMAAAETRLMEKLAADMIIRTQQAIRKTGGMEGYLPAINGTALRMIKINPEIEWRDYGIMLEEKSTYEQKQFLLEKMAGDIQNGFLDTSDAIYILNTYNIKQAQMLLAYKVKKAKQFQAEQQMALNAQTIQGQQQSALMSEEAKRQTLEHEYMLKAELLKMEKEYDLRLKEIELQYKYQMNAETAGAKVMTQQVANDGKIQAAAMKPVSSPTK